MILLHCIGGLANRMRVISSGVSMAKALNTNLIVIWPKSNELNCDFDKLFRETNYFKIICYSRTSSILSRFYHRNKLIQKLVKFYSILFSFNYILLDSDIQKKVWQPPIYRLDKNKIPSNTKNIFIKTSEEFFINTIPLKEIFKPINSIEKIINEQLNIINDKFIGIHIRRTDHKESIINSPLELFHEKISNEIASDNNVKFYLSTDSQDTIEEIITKYGAQRIFHYSKVLSRNSLEGMQSALVDFLMLANSKKIYGSYRSSFSELSSLFYNNEITVIKHEF